MSLAVIVHAGRRVLKEELRPPRLPRGTSVTVRFQVPEFGLQNLQYVPVIPPHNAPPGAKPVWNRARDFAVTVVTL
jgi:hypothetical protein